MEDKEIVNRVMQKKEFSELPLKDVELAFSKFDKEDYSDEEKVKFTRALLLKTFTFSLSKRLLTIKNKDSEWFLKKHVSTRDRISFYHEIYRRIFKDLKTASVIDLGCGINGFSYKYFNQVGVKVDYFGVEAIGQLVKLANNYFKKEKIAGEVFHFSLFDLERVKNLISKSKKPRVVFLFKVLDSLEIPKRNYTKKLLLEISLISDRIVLSFATKTMVKKENIKVKRTWILDFINKNFEVLDDFDIGAERFIFFRKKNKGKLYNSVFLI